MYICDNCGAVFENTISIREHHNELDDETTEEYHGCPVCKNSSVLKAVQCDLCGEYVAYDYVKLKDGTIACSDCYETF